MIRIKPNDSYAYFARAREYNRQHRPELAIKDYNEAIRLQYNYVDAYTGRAAAKESLGDKTGAAADRQRAQELRK